MSLCNASKNSKKSAKNNSGPGSTSKRRLRLFPVFPSVYRSHLYPESNQRTICYRHGNNLGTVPTGPVTLCLLGDGFVN
jgi:hypothetical protein